MNPLRDSDNAVYTRLALCSELKAKGFTDTQIMTVVALAQNEVLHEAMMSHMDEYPDATEAEVKQAIAGILERMHGGVVYGTGALNDPHTLVESLVGEDEFGTAARLLNTFGYLDGKRRWDDTYDHAWSSMLSNGDIAEAGRIILSNYPEAVYLGDVSFDQQSKLAKAKTLAALNDEILAMAARGVQVPRGYYGGEYAGMSRVYGLGKARVKMVRSVCVAPTSLPESVVEVDVPRKNDYVYVDSPEAVQLALGQGLRKFAAENPIVFEGMCVLDKARVWHLATYPTNLGGAPVEAPPAPEQQRPMSKMRMLAAQAAAGTYIPPHIRRAEKPAVEAPKEEPEKAETIPKTEGEDIAPVEVTNGEMAMREAVDDQPKQRTACPNMCLRVYNLLKTGPGRQYYLSAEQRKEFMSFHRALKAAHVDVPQPKPQRMGATATSVIPRPIALKDTSGSGGIDYNRLVYAMEQKLSTTALLHEQLITTADIDTAGNIKGSGKNTVNKMVRAATGASPSYMELAQAVVRVVSAKMYGGLEPGVCYVIGVQVQSMYAPDGKGGLIARA